MKIYLAHPISGLTADEVFDYYDEAAKFWRELGFTVLSPMLGKDHLRCEREFRAHGYKGPISTNHAIYERDKWMVQSADIVYLNLMGATEASQGCVTELAWASILGKHTVVAMEDTNPHQHAFILEGADVVFDCEEDAEHYIELLAACN